MPTPGRPQGTRVIVVCQWAQLPRPAGAIPTYALCVCVPHLLRLVRGEWSGENDMGCSAE